MPEGRHAAGSEPRTLGATHNTVAWVTSRSRFGHLWPLLQHEQSSWFGVTRTCSSIWRR